MASVTAAVGVAAPVAFSSATAASTSSTSRAQLLAPGGLKASTVSKSVEWSKKTVSNGSRTDAFLVVNPYTNLKFETLSYLPELTDEQIAKQVDYLLRNGLIPAIEFDRSAGLSRIWTQMPGYYEGRYWVMWKLPLFGANDPTQVLEEVKNCQAEYPEVFIRIIGFDNVRQVQIVSFLVAKPKSYLK